MRKRNFVLICILIVSVFLTGCGSSIPEMSEEETRMVTQYMAGLLLEYDTNYQSAMLNEEEKANALEEERKKAEELARQEEEARIKAEEEAANLQADDINVVQESEYLPTSDLNDFLGMDSVEFEFVSYEVVDKYPYDGEELFFSVNATPGKKLLIMKFNLANITGNTEEIDLLSMKIKYRVSINEENYQPVLTTLLEDDMGYYKGVLEAEQGISLVLVTEVSEDTTVNQIRLSVKVPTTGEETKLQLVN